MIVAEGAVELSVERRGRTIRLLTLGQAVSSASWRCSTRPATATCTAYEDAVVLECPRGNSNSYSTASRG